MKAATMKFKTQSYLFNHKIKRSSSFQTWLGIQTKKMLAYHFTVITSPYTRTVMAYWSLKLIFYLKWLPALSAGTIAHHDYHYILKKFAVRELMVVFIRLFLLPPAYGYTIFYFVTYQNTILWIAGVRDLCRDLPVQGIVKFWLEDGQFLQEIGLENNEVVTLLSHQDLEWVG